MPVLWCLDACAAAGGGEGGGDGTTLLSLHHQPWSWWCNTASPLTLWSSGNTRPRVSLLWVTAPSLHTTMVSMKASLAMIAETPDWMVERDLVHSSLYTSVAMANQPDLKRMNLVIILMAKTQDSRRPIVGLILGFRDKCAITMITKLRN